MSPTTKTEGKVGEQETHRYNFIIISKLLGKHNNSMIHSQKR